MLIARKAAVVCSEGITIVLKTLSHGHNSLNFVELVNQLGFNDGVGKPSDVGNFLVAKLVHH